MTARRDIFHADRPAPRAGPLSEDRSAPPASALAAPAAAFQRSVFPALRAGDVLGLQRAVGNRATAHLIARHPAIGAPLATATIQREVEAGKLNIVGELHTKSADRRADEKEMLKSFGPYWEEDEFTYRVGDETKHGDNLERLVIQSLMFLYTDIQFLESRVKGAGQGPADDLSTVQQIDNSDVQKIKERIVNALEETTQLKRALDRLNRSESPDEDLLKEASEKWMYLEQSLEEYKDDIEDAEQKQEDMPQTLAELHVSAGVWKDGIRQLLATHGYDLNTSRRHQTGRTRRSNRRRSGSSESGPSTCGCRPSRRRRRATSRAFGWSATSTSATTCEARRTPRSRLPPTRRSPRTTTPGRRPVARPRSKVNEVAPRCERHPANGSHQCSPRDPGSES